METERGEVVELLFKVYLERKWKVSKESICIFLHMEAK